MSVRDTLIANIDKTAYTSVWDMDKIIGVASGTFTISAPTPGPPVTLTTTSPTTFGDSYYFQAIYSTDNGASWNDFGSMIPDLTTPGMPVLQTLDVLGAVGAAGTFNVFASNYYDSVHGVGTAKTVKWKAIYYSKNRQGSLAPTNIGLSTLFTSVARNYQKIALKDEIPFDLTSGVAKSITLTHGLGYVPFVRAFYTQTSPATRIDSLWLGYRVETQITETTLSFVLVAALSTVTVTGNIEFRVYYDR